MAFERTPFEKFDTEDGVGGCPEDGALQRKVCDDLVQAQKDGRRGVFLLGAESTGAGKSLILRTAVEKMDGFALWIRPDEYALDSHLNLKRVVSRALQKAGSTSSGWFERWAMDFCGTVFATGLRAGLIASHDPETWARTIEEAPEKYLGAKGETGLLAWLSDERQATLRYQIALRLLSSDQTIFDEVDEALAWINFFLSDAPVSSSEWMARWVDMGNRAYAGKDVRFTRQTLALVNMAHPVVCLLDQLDGVMGRPELARDLARTVLDWSNCTSMVVIAVNREIWEGGFLPVIPESWSDRLSAWSNWLDRKGVSEPERFLKQAPSGSPDSSSCGERSQKRGRGDAHQEIPRSLDAQKDRTGGVPNKENDFLVFNEKATSRDPIDARRELFLDAGERLPFVTVAPETEEDQRMHRVRWNTPEHVAWIGLAEAGDKSSWQEYLRSFAAASMDDAAVKLVVPIFDDESESAIRDCATSEGLGSCLDEICWLHVLQLTPAGWWQSVESGKLTAESFVAASTLWKAITEPVAVKQ